MSTISNHYCSFLKHCCETHNQAELKKLHCLIIRTIVNAETFLLNNVVNSYNKLGNLSYARKVFDQISQPNLFSWNTVLSVYSKSGRVVEMNEIFDRMPRRDGVSWNLVISGYVACGMSAKAVEAYKMMVRDGVRDLNRITFSTMLILSSNKGYVGLGRQIHGQVVKCGFGSYVFVGSPLVDMYSKSGLIYDAERVFERLPERNVVMYNTMLSGLLRCGMVEESKCLFHGMPEKDSVSWTTMITGFTQNSLGREAIDLFRAMRLEGLGAEHQKVMEENSEWFAPNKSTVDVR
ncbi:hypothetical protein ACET3Z_031925 [Daucus carota]